MAEVVGLERVIARVRELRGRAAKPAAPLRSSADHMLGSIDRNFAAQGRPDRWEPHSDATRARMIGPPRILERSSRMRGGFRPRTRGRLGWGIGNPAARAYWPRQHFGYEGGGEGRGQSRTPARPFLFFQDEDVLLVGEMFAEFFFSR